MASRAKKTESTFRMECAIAIDIAAPPAKIWSLLTDAADFPRWNSTVEKIDGKIAEGQKIALVATVAPDRTFKLKVSDVQENRRMVWSDGFAPMFRGVRTFELEPSEDGVTHFTMAEVFSGAMLPMIKGSLPDFGPVFEQYVADLKKAAEG